MPLEESSGENPCQGDDEDCENPSGGESGFPVGEPGHGSQSTPDDIGFPDTPGPTKEDGKIEKHKTPTPESSTPKPSTDDINFPEGPDSGKGEDHGEEPKNSQTPSVSSTTTTDPMFFTVNLTTEAPKKGSPGGAAGGSSGGSTKETKEKNKRKGNSLPMNIGLIVGIAAAVVILFLVLAYAGYKYRSRDEGSYKIDESKNYSYETCNTKPPPHVNGGLSKSKGQTSKPRKKDVKEWYVWCMCLLFV